MKDKKSFAFVYEFLPSVRCAVIVAGWGLWSFETKELAEHCARDINQAQADGIKEAVAERDARIATLEKELAEWKESARAEAEEADKARERIAELEKALEPFAHPGLSEVLSGICMGDDSTVFQWNKATLLVRHFKKARKALGKGE